MKTLMVPMRCQKLSHIKMLCYRDSRKTAFFIFPFDDTGESNYIVPLKYIFFFIIEERTSAPPKVLLRDSRNDSGAERRNSKGWK